MQGSLATSAPRLIPTASSTQKVETPETLEHAYAECGEVAHLWRLVTTAWNTNMEQQLDPSDLRLRLLGDRGEHKCAANEEAWRVVHAATAFTIHTTRTRQHSGGEYPRARLMLREVKKTVEEAARRRLAKQKAAGNMQDFRRAWHDSGAATHHNDGLKVHALDAGRCNAVVVNQATRLTTYTDGGHDAKDSKANAGWGLVEILDDTCDDTGCVAQTRKSEIAEILSAKVLTFAESGRVVTRRGEPGYNLAVRATSQTAELTAMLMALRRAKARGKAAPPEYIKTDSVYAMKTARGEWKTKKGTNEAIAREVRKAYIQVRETRGAGAVTITMSGHTAGRWATR